MKRLSKFSSIRLTLFLMFGAAFSVCIVSLRAQSATQANVDAALKRQNVAQSACSDVSDRISAALTKQISLQSSTLPGDAKQAAFHSSQAEINRLLAEQTRLNAEYSRAVADCSRAIMLNNAGMRRGTILSWVLQPILWGMIAIGILERRAKKRRALRLKNNQCVNCGYDLRASTGRCSECGTEIPIPAQRATNPLA